MGRPAMLKFLTDENIYPSTIELLRSYSLDVIDIKELGLAGISDREIMDFAKKEGRIVISLDLHFANIFRPVQLYVP
jgi:predicted nuclease of predicted toxin-antitoxin system